MALEPGGDAIVLDGVREVVGDGADRVLGVAHGDEAPGPAGHRDVVAPVPKETPSVGSRPSRSRSSSVESPLSTPAIVISREPYIGAMDRSPRASSSASMRASSPSSGAQMMSL
ncbi:hypothetical protein EVA_15825 [gut metagenome]|uniref:Uncharacterized protein n=1 Tax=gut metagenome TaxID=749906 RepID=J9FNP6_9ZZZZ